MHRVATRPDHRGTTLVELTVATALMATVFAAIMPLFAGIRNSADARWASLEMVQNARVLNEQLCRYLTQARRIVAFSASTDDGGYLEFEAQDGVVYRCAVGTRGYIEFGPVGKLCELAGPVEYLRFACYSDERSRPARADAGGRSAGELGGRTQEHRTAHQGQVTRGGMLPPGQSVDERPRSIR